MADQENESSFRATFESLICYFRRLATFGLSVSTAVFLYLVLPLGDLRAEPSTLTVVVWATIASTALVVRTLLTTQTKSKFDWPTDQSQDLVSSKAEPVQLADEYEAEFKTLLIDRDIGLAFLETLIDPGQFITRITETVELSQPQYVSTSIRNYSNIKTISGVPNRRLLVPILRQPKGRLVDKLKVDADGLPARTLSHRESHGAMIYAIKMLIFIAFKRKSDYDIIFDTVRQHILSDTPSATDAQKELVQLISERLPGKDAQGVTEEMRIAGVALIGLVMQLCSSYFVIAIVDQVGTREFAKIKCTHASGNLKIVDKRYGALRRIHAVIYYFLRASFGLTARTHTLKLPLATEAQSYHLRVDLPESMYVYEHRIDLRTVSEQDSDRDYPKTKTRWLSPDLRLSPTRGLSHVHAYARDLDVLTNSRSMPTEVTRVPTVTFEMRERPPGLLFIVWILAVFLAIVGVGVGVYHNLIFGLDVNVVDSGCLLPGRQALIDGGQSCSPTRTSPSGWPTLLFGIPALVSGWLVSRFTQESVTRLSLSTIAVTSWSVVNTLIAVILAALKFGVPAIAPMSLFNTAITQPLWSILVVSCVAHAVMCSLLLFFRIRRYVERHLGGESFAKSTRH